MTSLAASTLRCRRVVAALSSRCRRVDVCDVSQRDVTVTATCACYTISKMQQLEPEQFAIPVTEETPSKVNVFVRNIYMEAKSVKEAFHIAKQEPKGSTKVRLSAAQKIDPAVLWVLCTIGCRQKALLSIYKDEQMFSSDGHQSWCCDRCAKELMDHRDKFPTASWRHSWTRTCRYSTRRSAFCKGI